MDLVALPFADEDRSISFRWTKPGRRTIIGNQNELTVEKVTQAHCKGFYVCDVLKDNKPYFRVYYCLKATSKLILPSLLDHYHLSLQITQYQRRISYCMMLDKQQRNWNQTGTLWPLNSTLTMRLEG